MRRPHILTRTSLSVLCLAMAAAADQGDYIVTLKNSANASALTQQFLVQVKAILHGNDTFLVTPPSGPLGNLIMQAVKSSPLVQGVDADAPLQLPEVASHGPNSRTYPASVQTCATPNALKTGQLTPSQYYQDQPAVCQISLPAVRKGYQGVGVTMALIDTWVDANHPEFNGKVDPTVSMSFADPLHPIPLAQETSPMVDQETSPMVDQETSPMVDGSGAIILNQETSPMVDQETSPMVDSNNPPYAGHGTGVAGIMHLTAPQARIAALEAFSAKTGTGSLSSIVAAIYYAADVVKANVINMSFTVPSGTPGIDTLSIAIQHAQAMGSVVVASVPDTGGGKSLPAGYDGVTAVACVDSSDAVCTFSGHVGWSDIYAPGYQVMSLYPKSKKTGLYRHALYTGTSFSAPWATGTAALFNFKLADALKDRSKASSDALGEGDQIRGVERLDAVKAISAAH